MSLPEYVIDSHAMLAFLQKDPGYGRIETILKAAVAGEAKVYISAVNLAEVQYQVLRRGKDSSRILAALEALPLIVTSADSYIPQVVELRAKYDISLGNCFAAALAQDLRRPLITGDRNFHKLGSAITVEWLH